jgi:hypothetical protein
MMLDVDERSSSFFDDIEEKQILSEAKITSGLVSGRSHQSDRVGDHLKVDDDQGSSIRDLL